jgi:hypothetical protein
MSGANNQAELQMQAASATQMQSPHYQVRLSGTAASNP